MSTDNNGDHLLVSRAKASDRAAFDVLFDKLRDRLSYFIQSRIRPEYRGTLSADEILQDTFVRAFQSIARFRGEDEATFRRWITGIANKAVLRAEEDARRHQTLEIDHDVPAADVSPSKTLRRNERFDRFQESLDALSDDYREVLFLTRIEGLSIKQVAERMGPTDAAVKMIFLRALKKLRKTMGDTESLNLPDRSLDGWEAQDAE